MEQKMMSLQEHDLVAQVDVIREKVLAQFSLMEKEIGNDFDDMTAYFSGVKLREAFNARMDELKKLVEQGDVIPNFKLNINRDDDYLALDRDVSVVFFPFAGNPPHWGHLITAIDALIQCKADKVIFISNGNDFRKPHLTDKDIRYDMIRDAISFFEPFIEFGNLAETPLFDSSLPLIGEYSLFRFFKLNPLTKMTAYYLAGSDHLHRTVVRNGESQNDTIGYLEDNMYEQLFEYNSEYHTVVALMNARDKKEFDTKFTEIVNPKVEIKRLNPTISFSSTELREALEGTGHPEALLFLPYVNYRKIVDNDWYRKLNN